MIFFLGIELPIRVFRSWKCFTFDISQYHSIGFSFEENLLLLDLYKIICIDFKSAKGLQTPWLIRKFSIFSVSARPSYVSFWSRSDKLILDENKLIELLLSRVHDRCNEPRPKKNSSAVSMFKNSRPPFITRSPIVLSPGTYIISHFERLQSYNTDAGSASFVILNI